MANEECAYGAAILETVPDKVSPWRIMALQEMALHALIAYVGSMQQKGGVLAYEHLHSTAKRVATNDTMCYGCCMLGLRIAD